MAEERLSDDEIARVLRRATELDITASTTDDGLPVAAVEAAAAEVGVSPAAVRQAVAELRTGALDPATTEQPGYSVVCARVVPGTTAGAVEAAGRWLHVQAMAVVRDRGTEQVWRPREDWFAGIQRRFDFSASLKLKPVDEVVVRAVEVEGGVLLRLAARLEPGYEVAPRLGAGAGAVLGGGVAGLLGLLNVDPALVGALAAGVPGGAAAGTVGFRLGRNVRARHRQRVAEALDGLLDDLEHGRQPGGRRSIDKLAERARRLRGGYRL